MCCSTNAPAQATQSLLDVAKSDNATTPSPFDIYYKYLYVHYDSLCHKREFEAIEAVKSEQCRFVVSDKGVLNLRDRIGMRTLAKLAEKPDAESVFSAAIQSLTASNDLDHVHYLDLSLNPLDDDDVPRLAAFVKHFPNLEILDLNQNFFHSESQREEVSKTLIEV